VCGLLESLLAAEPGLAGRLDCLVGQLARYTPDPPLIAWLRRMFSLLASLDKSLLKDVSIGQSALRIHPCVFWPPGSASGSVSHKYGSGL
jgi:hypothetical protein